MKLNLGITVSFHQMLLTDKHRIFSRLNFSKGFYHFGRTEFYNIQKFKKHIFILRKYVELMAMMYTIYSQMFQEKKIIYQMTKQTGQNISHG